MYGVKMQYPCHSLILPKINLLCYNESQMLDSIREPHNPDQRNHHQAPHRPKSRFRFFLALTMLALLAGGIFIGSKVVIYAQKVLEGKDGKFSFSRLFISSDKSLTGEENKEIHILLMGIGGESHEGPNLTDTMIVATVKLPDNSGGKVKVGLYSIPRDLAVNIPGYDYRKINSAYAYGEMAGKDMGSKLAINAVERLLNISIPYYGVVDFRGFEKVVDDLGGITVDVDQAFTDKEYPDEKNGYLSPITFEKGRQTMDGARALKYVRSRHGNNNEGTDFARSRRQQKILKAVKDKAAGLRIITNLGLVDRILNDLSDHVRTNMEPYEIKRIYDLVKNISEDNIVSQALDVESGTLCDEIEAETGAYLLVPCAGLSDYTQIRNLFQNQFQDGQLAHEEPVVKIQNASGLPQLGRAVQTAITLPHMKISVGNFRGETLYFETIIYDNTGGQKKETLNYLKSTLGSRVAAGPFPFQTAGTKPDFVIVVASDLKNRLQQ